MRKLSTAETLAAQIQDGATIAISGAFAEKAGVSFHNQ